MIINDSIVTLKNSRTPITFCELDGVETSLTYSELYQNALKLLGGLQCHGLKKNDPLVLQLKSVQAQITASWAAMLGGIIFSILPIAQDEKSRTNLKSVLNTLDSPSVLTDLDGLSTIKGINALMYPVLLNSKAGLIENCSECDPAMIQFTSGTTSNPKGAILTQKNLYEGGLASSIVVREGKTERYLSWLPLSHCFGFVGYHLVPLVNDFPQYLMHPMEFIKNPVSWLEKLSDFEATMTGAALFGLELLLNAGIKPHSPIDLSSVYICFCGGEDVNPNTLRDFEIAALPFGWQNDTLKPAYGLSETTMGVSYTPVGQSFRVEHFLSENQQIGAKLFFCDSDEDTISRVSVGVLDECNEVVIRDLQGNDLPPEFLGIINIRGTNVMQGYYLDSATTNRAIDQNGFFNTGDLGFFHQGWLTVYGRYKDIIIVNGENYLVNDLERTAQSHILSGKQVIVQVKDKKSKINKLVIFSDTNDLNSLVEASKAIKRTWHLSIDFGVLIEAIPKNASGKTDRLTLSVNWEKGVYESAAHSLTPKVNQEIDASCQELAQIWSQILKIPVTNISSESHFINDLGGDSLYFSDLIGHLEKKYQKEYDFESFRDYLTLQEMNDFLNHN
ncbi:non-ribosomal peptide synthetase [Eubacteriaceae bacterium ES2]|nr:non-ribosomal peptide synthetase [Eubacteriaceae bacterium ES2]